MLTLPRPNFEPLYEFGRKTHSFGRLLVDHLSTHWIAYVLVFALVRVLSANYVIGINETPSLPQTFFIIDKGAKVSKGDYVSFKVPPAASRHFTNPNVTLTKVLIGLPGDKVTVIDRVVHLNGVPVGYAKTHSRDKEPLTPIAEGVIPFGYLFVVGLHRDSLDSRYDMVGLVPHDTVVGRAHPLF